MTKQVVGVTGNDFQHLYYRDFNRREIAVDGECDMCGPDCRSHVVDQVGNLSPMLSGEELQALNAHGRVFISFDRVIKIDFTLLCELGWVPYEFRSNGFTHALCSSICDPMELLSAKQEAEARLIVADDEYPEFDEDCGLSDDTNDLFEEVFGMQHIEDTCFPNRIPIRKPEVLRTVKLFEDGRKKMTKVPAHEAISRMVTKSKLGSRELRARDRDDCDSRTTIRGASIEVEEFTVRSGKRNKKRYIIYSTPRVLR